MECFLYKTQKSLRHIKILFDKYMIFIKDKFSEESVQVKALETVYRVWQNDEHKTVNIMNEFLDLGMISPLTMLKYLIF